MRVVHLSFVLLLSTSAMSFASQAFDIVAHRGASGYLPEHTLEAMALAHAQGPAFIEQDLVLTRDNALVVLHDIHLETVTDVEQKFPNRAREDGRFYALDFTLAELKTLQVHERENADGTPVFPNRYQGKGQFTVATLEEQLTSIAELNRLTGANIGYYPEIKSPAWHRAEGYDISKIVLDTLRRHKLDTPDANIYLQCFDFEEVKRIRNELGAKVKMVQLIADNDWGESPTNYARLKTPAGMREAAQYVQGIGPWLGHVTQSTNPPSFELADWVQTAQAEGLQIHPYTFRLDALPPGITAEQLLQLIVGKWKFDGVFTDQVPPVKAFIEHIEQTAH